MSKTGWIILIVCLGLVFCICAGLFLAGRIANSHLFNGGDTRVDSSATKNYKDLKNDYSADGSYSVTMKDLKELHIDWISGSVMVELIDGDTIRIQEVANKAIKEKDALRFGTSGGTLRIQACKKNYIGKLPSKDLVVYLPPFPGGRATGMRDRHGLRRRHVGRAPVGGAGDRHGLGQDHAFGYSG